MKLISLNTWGGKIYQPLIEFISQRAKDTDIFCLQEIQDTKSDIKQHGDIRPNLLSEMKQILSNFQVFYLPVISGYDDKADPVNFDLTFGSAIFVKNTIKISSNADYIISKGKVFPKLKKDFSNLPTPLQSVNFTLNGKKFVVFNFHGTPMPGDKLDTLKRLEEAKRTKDIIKSYPGAKIIVGDFNLLPQTQSIKIFAENMRNLISEFNIEKTRSSLSSFYDSSKFQKFADYTFVSPDVKIIDLQVPDIEVSDHLPMILEFL